MFCLLNHRTLVVYTATAMCILMPAPVLIFIATGKRGLTCSAIKDEGVSHERIAMFKANTMAGLGKDYNRLLS